MARGIPNGRSSTNAGRGTNSAMSPASTSGSRRARGLSGRSRTPAQPAGAATIPSGPYRLTLEQDMEALELVEEAERAVELDLDRDARVKLTKMIASLSSGESDGHTQRRHINEGGYVGNAAQPGTDLFRLAVVCAAGDEAMQAQALTYLKRAEEHQAAYINRLDEAMKAPRTRSSMEVWKAAGVTSTNTPYQMNAMDAAIDVMTQIKKYLDLGTRVGAKVIGGPTRSKDGVRLRARRVEGVFGQLLIDGKPEIAHRFASLVASTVDAGLSDTLLSPDIKMRMDNCARVCRAYAANEERGIYPLRDLEKYSDDYVKSLRAEREGGDAYEAFRDATSVAPVGTMGSMAEILSSARTMSREPRLYSVNSDSMVPGVEIHIPATLEALQELSDARIATKNWHRVYASIRPETPAGGKRSVWLGTRMAVSVGEQKVALIVEARVGSTTLSNTGKLRDWIQEKADEFEMADLVAGAPLVEEYAHIPQQGQPRIVPNALMAEGTPGTLIDLLGEDRCRHEDGQWIPTGSDVIHDAVRLSCRTCHRSHVTVVPLHRLPEWHPVRTGVFEGDTGARVGSDGAERSNEERYLMRERYHAALRDDERPIESVEQLVARDGLADLDPTRYAIGFDDDIPKNEATRRQVRSIRDAMMRR